MVEFGPTEQTVYALAEIGDLIHLREWTLTWWSDVVERFWALKEFRAIIQLFQEWVFVRGDLSESEEGLVGTAGGVVSLQLAMILVTLKASLQLLAMGQKLSNEKMVGLARREA